MPTRPDPYDHRLASCSTAVTHGLIAGASGFIAGALSMEQSYTAMWWCIAVSFVNVCLLGRSIWRIAAEAVSVATLLRESYTERDRIRKDYDMLGELYWRREFKDAQGLR